MRSLDFDLSLDLDLPCVLDSPPDVDFSLDLDLRFLDILLDPESCLDLDLSLDVDLSLDLLFLLSDFPSRSGLVLGLLLCTTSSSYFLAEAVFLQNDEKQETHHYISPKTR